MDNIKSNLKGVIGSSSNGLPLNQLENEYYKVTHSQLNYYSYGYANIRSFLESIPKICKVTNKGGELMVTMVVTNDDPIPLKNLAGLIKNTRNRKKRGNYQGREVQNYNRVNSSMERFTISVENDYCSNSLPNVSKGFLSQMKYIDETSNSKKKGNNYGFDSNGSIMSLNHGRCDNALNERCGNVMNLLKDGSVKQSRKGLTSSLNKGLAKSLSNDNASLCSNGHGTPCRNGHETPISNGYGTLNINGHATPTSNDHTPSLTPTNNRIQKCQSEVSLDWGCWILKPEIDFESLHKQVNVLGVQSGQAVVVGVSTTLCRDLLKSKNVTTFFPGDIILWQPPFNDPLRIEDFVDIQTAFPATIIKRSEAKKVHVRILGLTTLLEVSISDIFEMPLSSEYLSKICKAVKSREVTMVTLAVIPSNIDIWEETVYTGIFTVAFSIDEGGLVLEKSIKRGQFLNLILLNYIQESMLVNFNIEEISIFIKHLAYLLERSISAISPTYEQLISEKDVYPEGNPLRLIFNTDECKDEIMIGAVDLKEKSFFRETLYRLKYWDNKRSFYSVDNQSHDVPLPHQRPLPGIYIVNDKYICCAFTKNDSLRFKTALLASLPSLADLSITWNLHKF